MCWAMSLNGSFISGCPWQETPLWLSHLRWRQIYWDATAGQSPRTTCSLEYDPERTAWPLFDSWINISGTGSILKSVTAYAESLGDCCEIGSQWRCVLKMECFFAVQNKWDSILWHCRRVWECLNILRWNTYRNFVRKLKLIWINHNYSSI